MPRLFISYRREEASYVAAMLAERLRAAFGDASVYIDVDAIPFGIDFRDHIRDAVARCDVLLAIIGRQWLTAQGAAGGRRIDDPADFVRLEIEAALGRSIPVVPVLIDGTPMPPVAELPEALAPLAFRNAAELRAGRDMDHHLGLIVDGLRQLLGGIAAAAPATTVPAPAPPAAGTPAPLLQPLPAPAPSPMSPRPAVAAEAGGLLRLLRERQLAGSAIACRVLLDGQPMGDLRPGDTLECPAAAGTHRLEVRHRGALFDARLDLVIAPGQTLAWDVSMDWKGAIKLSPR